MRKPKIILGAVLAIAFVGAMFAFKVREEVTIYTHKAGDPLTLCTVPLNKWTTTDESPNFTRATFVSTLPCAPTFITTTE